MGAGESAPVQLELKEGTRLDPVLAQHIVTCFKENNEKGKPLTPKRFEDVMEQVRILYGSQVAAHDYEYLYNLFDLNHDGKGTASDPFSKRCCSLPSRLSSAYVVGLEELLSGFAVLSSGTLEEKAQCASRPACC
jgi:hypothetical protein